MSTEKLIDAEDLRHSLYRLGFEGSGEGGDVMWQSGCYVRYKVVEKLIDDAPAVEAKRQNPKKWILREYPGIEYVVCPHCGSQFDPDALYIGGGEYPPYCPECGEATEF